VGDLKLEPKRWRGACRTRTTGRRKIPTSSCRAASPSARCDRDNCGAQCVHHRQDLKVEARPSRRAANTNRSDAPNRLKEPVKRRHHLRNQSAKPAARARAWCAVGMDIDSRQTWLAIAAISRCCWPWSRIKPRVRARSRCALSGACPFLLLSTAFAASAKASGADNLIVRPLQAAPVPAVIFAALMGALSPFCLRRHSPLAALLATGVPLGR